MAASYRVFQARLARHGVTAENVRKKCDSLLTAAPAVPYIAVIDDAPPATGRRRVSGSLKLLTTSGELRLPEYLREA
ncbi:hypothetical protein [Blastochloris viridis]|uniref:Uncharacterized protein n=1 Tax=Blastochloris viridis TaxID=1079 RepID=A0A182D1F8_BLAVI|nr:hypothetical protein [Blastochloris viridis]BAR98612.1 hypothetical protein BV133_1019 [Blastochloris viridis]